MSLFTKLLTLEVAEKALYLADPMIKKMMDSETIKRHDLHIVIAKRNPAAESGYDTIADMSFGDVSKWEHPYNVIAHGKTRISARTGKPSRHVQLGEPELLEADDVMFWGNAIRGDIIVSCSGVQPYFDEAISNSILWIILGIIQDVIERKKSAGNSFYSE